MRPTLNEIAPAGFQELLPSGSDPVIGSTPRTGFFLAHET